MNDLVINRQATPIDKANFARSQGAPGLAIHELEEINDAGSNPAAIRPILVDLYCDAGMPEKALDVIGNLNVDDPSLSTGVGTASYRQGKVYFLLGNYENAVTLWREQVDRPAPDPAEHDGPGRHPDVPERRARRARPGSSWTSPRRLTSRPNGSSSWPWPRSKGACPPSWPPTTSRPP